MDCIYTAQNSQPDWPVHRFFEFYVFDPEFSSSFYFFFRLIDSDLALPDRI